MPELARPVAERPRLILGSSSPRRRDLLDVVGLRYEVIKPDTPEVPHPGEAPEAYVQRNAREKAAWVAAALAPRLAAPAGTGFIVICADTIVVLDGTILEKPRDTAHATEMLGRLSGQVHTVLSGVTLRGFAAPGAAAPLAQELTFVAATAVRLKRLSAREIAAYICTGEPLDKAGAYAAQGIGSYMVESIEGSYSNVVGLPVAAVVAHLESAFGYDLWP